MSFEEVPMSNRNVDSTQQVSFVQGPRNLPKHHTTIASGTYFRRETTPPDVRLKRSSGEQPNNETLRVKYKGKRKSACVTSPFVEYEHAKSDVRTEEHLVKCYRSMELE